MASVEDPLAEIGIDGFTSAFRSGLLSSERVTRAYLDRIEALDGQLKAFEHVAAEEAMAAARAVDQMREAGVDLGPLMGVPVSVKDLFTVKGMPVTAGSRIDIQDLVDPLEGPFIQALRRCGCVILGKTRMVEFALGITGISAPRGTPWNPQDLETHRLPGGSSSGAGVSVAAGLCAMAIGTDTGGSARVPAALCGVFGLKTTFGLWPMEGAFPLSTELDSIGLLTRSARDAAIAYGEITRSLHGSTIPFGVADLSRLRFAQPRNYFFEGLSTEVDRVVTDASERLRLAGVSFDALEIPQAPEREAYFPLVLPASLIAVLGRERFEANRELMDPVVAVRASTGLETKASDYLALAARRKASSRDAVERFEGFDAWISPTTAEVAPPLAEVDVPEKSLAQALGMTRNTQPANYLGLCAASLPLPRRDGGLPVGYQLMCPANSDTQLLSIAMAVEEVLGSAAISPAV